MSNMMKKSMFILAFSILFSIYLPTGVFAKTISNDNATVSAHEVINDDLFISGGNVKVLGTVHGDVYAVGGDIIINGTVDGDVLAAGGTVLVSGIVKNNVRAAGGSVTLSDVQIGRNVTVFGGDITQQSVQVTGKTYKFIPNKSTTSNSTPFSGGFPIISFLSTFLVGALLLKYAKPVVDRISQEIQTQQNASLLAGFIALFATPFILFFLIITIVGIPLAFIGGVLFAIDIYLSKIFVGAFIGEYVNTRFKLKSDNKYLNFAVGLVIIDIALLIPVLNFFVGILVLLLGLGAIVRVKKAYLFSGKK